MRALRSRLATRLLAAVTACAFVSALFVPQPASAANPTLDVLLLDPTLSTSASQTGSAPFDAGISYDGTPATAGQDQSAKDHVVRTNDLITYDFQYSVNTADATNLQFTSTLPLNGGLPSADWTGVPSVCQSGSAISNGGQTLTCLVGNVTVGTAQDLVAAVKVRSTTPNGTTFQPTYTVTDVTSAVTVTRTGYWSNQTTQSTLFDTITGTQKINLLKQTALVRPTSTYTYFGEGGIQGYYVTYPVLLQEGNGTLGGRVGITATTTPISFTDTLTPGLTATLPAANACGINGSGVTIGGIPYGSTALGTTNNSVVNSGTITCSQPGGAGTPVTVTVTGADTSGSSFPIANRSGSAVESSTWVVSGYLRLWVPDTAGNLGSAGNIQAFSDAYSGINPGYDVPANLTVSTNLTAQGPAPASGAAAKAFYTDDQEHGFAFSNNNGVGITAGTQIVSAFAITNTSTLSTGNVGIATLYACDVIDTAHVLAYPFDGTTGAASATYGGAVKVHGGTILSGDANLTVQYGDSTSSCTGNNTGWYSTIDAATSTNPNYYTKITQVRAVYTNFAQSTSPAPQTQLRLQLNLLVGAGLAAGTLVTHTVNATGAAATGGTALSVSASVQGQILVQNVVEAKNLWKNTAGNSLFNPPSTNGPGGFVDDTQQFVAFLDTDGRQGTLPTNGVVTCDLIDTTKFTLANFDGTTGPAVGTYGGPVSFAAIGAGSSLPGSITVEYSTAPVVANDNCRNVGDNWQPSTAVPSLATVTKVRATFNLPQVTLLRMYVNLKVNAGLAVGTVLTNSMVSTPESRKIWPTS